MADRWRRRLPCCAPASIGASRRAAAMLLLLLLHCLGSGFVLPTADAAAAVIPPGYSWDTLPVHWFSANATGQLDAAAAARIAARHSLVIFNGQSHAYQAPPCGKGSEGKMIEGGRLIRQAADRLGIPHPAVLAYFNSVVGVRGCLLRGPAHRTPVCPHTSYAPHILSV
jgi:hypothetical protein